MRKLFLLGMSLFAAEMLGGAAQAADMPLKAPAPAAAPFSWTGCYIGANAGWARAEHDLSTFARSFAEGNNIIDTARTAIINAGSASISDDSFIVGGTSGCNFQTNNWVWGIESDFNATGLKSHRDTGEVIEPVSGRRVRSIDEVKVDWLSTMRARLGLAFDQTLIYVTGGAAIADIKAAKSFSWNFADGCPILGTLNNCHVGGSSGATFGWTAGAGIEWAFAPRWSVKGEYLFVRVDDFTFGTFNRTTFVGVAAQTANHRVDTDLHIARIGLNYRINP